MSVSPIDRIKMEAGFNHCNHRVTYGYGDKPELGSDSSTFSTSDCSGYSRWLVYLSTGMTISDGSDNQHNWCSDNLQSVPLSEARADQTNRVFMCFITPSDGDNGVGHVYFLMNGYTVECCGGEQYSPIYGKDVTGVMSRPWNTPVLAEQTSAAYLWPSFIP